MLDSVGRRVRVASRNGPRVGIARSVDEEGNLVVEFDGGEESVRVDDAGILEEL
jgi:biotin-(acetyl-CoA carboxylase) ligase